MKTTLFENYEMFIREHADDISSPAGAARMIQDTGMFQAYMDSLTEGLDEEARASVMAVANRQREMLLTESANVPSSSFGSGWTVLSFPILTDIYAEPIIAQLCNVYPISTPVISIPRVRIKATTTSYDGTTTTSTIIPTATQQVRAGTMSTNVAPGTAVNVFTALGISAETFKMNRRYTMVTNIRVTETDAGSTTHTHDLSVALRPDNRAQIVAEIEFDDSTTTSVTLNLTGHVDYDSGQVTVNGLFSSASTSTFALDYATFTLRFVPVATQRGRTKVSIDTELTDVTVDPNEDFMIDLSEETMQDYKTIFKIDVIRILSEAIKRQVLLNKDFDLSYFLTASEPDMTKQGTILNVDLNDYNAASGDYMPANITDILKAVSPRISTLMSLIYRNFNMYPTYLVTGLKSASLLRSLQDMMVSMAASKQGELGWSGSNAQFMKLKILESPSIGDDKMYLSTKAPSNALEKSTIVDLIFNPLYIVKEITDGQTRHYVRARTMVEVARTDGLGLLNVQNIDTYIA